MFKLQSHEKASKPLSLMGIYCSVAIFLFSAISLVAPSGFSYGAALLLLGSFVLLYLRPRFALERHDWIFILTLAGYFLINALLNIYHGLPANAYDKPSRYLLAIPVYLFLISSHPKQSYLCFGLAIGLVCTAAFSIGQQFNVTAMGTYAGRSSGFLNPIQFGNISILMSMLILPFLMASHNNNSSLLLILLLFLSFMCGLAASFLSLSRGGWIAIPVIVIALHKDLIVIFKRTSKTSLILASVFIVGCVYFSPNIAYVKDRVISAGLIELNYFYQGNLEQVNTSASSRIRMWLNGFSAFSFRPILGWGELDLIKVNFHSQWVELNKIDNFSHLHNEYIDALAKKGLVGFTALMAMYLIPLYYFIGLMRTRQVDVMPFAAAGVVLILCVMVFGLTQCFLAHNSGTMVFVFYLVIIKAYCRNIVAARIPAAQT